MVVKKLFQCVIFSMVLFLFFSFASAQNLLQDAGFEESNADGTFPSSGHWISAWYPSQSGAVVTTTAKRSGSNGLWAYTASTTLSGWSGIYQEINTQPGEVFYAEGYIRNPSGQGWVTGSSAFIRVEFVGQNWWNVLKTHDSNKMTTANSNWGKYSLTTDPAPEGTTKVIVRTYVQKPATTTAQQTVVNFDDIYLEKIETPECVADNDCAHLNKNYCLGDLVRRDEGKCINSVCESETATIQDCNVLNNDYCDGTKIKHDDYTCLYASCVLDKTTTLQECDDGIYCNGQETCLNAQCIAGTPVDCSSWNILRIATCNNNPDNNPFTWDFRNSFTSICNEVIKSCTTGSEEITHTCSINNCGAECENDGDCDGDSFCMENCKCSQGIDLSYCSEISENNAYLHLNEQMDKFHSSFDVYTDSDAGGNHFVHMAKMDDENALVYIYNKWKDNCYNGVTCIRNEFVADISNRGGWYFQNGILTGNMTKPIENWGNYSNAGFDLSGATEVEFWARGENGGEKIEFFVFGVGRDPEWGTILQPYPDSSARVPSIGNYITLTNEWQRYTIDISSADKSYVIGGFAWYAISLNNPEGAVFYLDDIKYNYPRLDEPRFIVSYETILSDLDFDVVLKNFAYVYDNSLAIMAYIARGTVDDMKRAKLLADAIVYAQENDRYYDDGRIRNAYKAGDLTIFPGWTPNNKVRTVSMPGRWDNTGENWYEDNFTVSTHTGNVAWAMLALLEYYKKDNNEKYLNASVKFGEWIYENTYDLRGTGGYTGGYEGWEPDQSKIMWKSTEHNLDVYVVFMRLYNLTEDLVWKDKAIHAKIFIESMWDNDNQHFWTGTLLDGASINKNTIPADVQAWALMVTGNLEKYGGNMIFVEENCFVNASKETGFIGFDFNTDLDGIWWEGTAHNVLAFQIKSETEKSDFYLNELCKAQILSERNNGKGIVAADRDNVSTGFDWEYFNRLHIGSTSWYIMAHKQLNPYWGIHIEDKVPWSEMWGESSFYSEVYFIPNKSTPLIGTDFSVNISLSTLEKIFAGQFNVYFNQTVLEVLEINEGNFLKKDGADTFPIVKINNSIGKIEFANTRFGTQEGVSGEGTLASIIFRAKNPGLSDLILDNVILSDSGLNEIPVLINNGFVEVKILKGDVNGDCVVNIFDLAAVGLAYGSTPESVNWNENADLNNDGIVNIFDLAIVGLNYGKSC